MDKHRWELVLPGVQVMDPTVPDRLIPGPRRRTRPTLKKFACARCGTEIHSFDDEPSMIADHRYFDCDLAIAKRVMDD